MPKQRKRSSRRSTPVAYSVYIVELDRRCTRVPCAFAPLYVGTNGALAGRTVRPAQGRWHARGSKATSLRGSAALRPDEGDWSVQDPHRSRSRGDGGRQRAREARPPRLLGLTISVTSRRSASPFDAHAGAVPAEVRRPRSGQSRCAFVCARYGRPVQNQLDQLTAGRHVEPPP